MLGTLDARDKPGQGAFGGKLGGKSPHELPSTFPGQPCACGERVGVEGRLRDCTRPQVG